MKSHGIKMGYLSTILLQSAKNLHVRFKTQLQDRHMFKIIFTSLCLYTLPIDTFSSINSCKVPLSYTVCHTLSTFNK